jgi:hypothetical protein
VDERLSKLPPKVRGEAEQRGREVDVYVLLSEVLDALNC